MAVRFNADNQAYTRTTSLGSQTAFSVACWVKLASDRNNFSTVLSLDDGTAGADTILQTDSDGTTLTVVQTTGGSSPAGRALTVGTWYFVGIIVNGTTGTFITRAATDSAVTVQAFTAPASTDCDVFRIGDSQYPSEYLDGTVAAVKWWTAALTQAELVNEAWTYMPQRTTNLAAWYPLTRAETADYSGRGQTLSGGSGTATEDGPGIAWRQGRRKALTPLSVPAEATPDAIGAPWSVPTPAVSLGAGTTPSAVAAPGAVPTPSVYTGSPVTAAEPPAIGAPWTVPTPAAEAFKNVTVTPAPIVATWAIPTPVAGVPVNPGDDLDGPGQLSYNGFKMGGGTAYGWVQLDGAGLDMPGVDNGNVAQPSSHGSISGRKLSQARIITYTTKITAPKDEIEQTVLDLLNATPLPEADEELDLAIQVMNTIYVCRGAVLRRAAPITKDYRQGFVRGVVQWECSNPRLYSRQLNSATIADGSAVDVFNAGNAPTHPYVRVPGPANGPMLTLERVLADGGTEVKVVEFDLEVAPGETLILDPLFGVATIGGVNKTRYLTGASIGIPDWVLGRSATTVEYETQEGGAPAAVLLWRDAWI